MASAAQALGIDLATNSYKVLGSPSTPFPATAQPDIVRAVARLALLALDPATADSVPTNGVHIAGNNVNVKDIAAAVTRMRGVQPGTIESSDLAGVKESLIAASPEEQGKRFTDYVM